MCEVRVRRGARVNCRPDAHRRGADDRARRGASVAGASQSGVLLGRSTSLTQLKLLGRTGGLSTCLMYHQRRGCCQHVVDPEERTVTAPRTPQCCGRGRDRQANGLRLCSPASARIPLLSPGYSRPQVLTATLPSLDQTRPSRRSSLAHPGTVAVALLSSMARVSATVDKRPPPQRNGQPYPVDS